MKGYVGAAPAMLERAFARPTGMAHHEAPATLSVAERAEGILQQHAWEVDRVLMVARRLADCHAANDARGYTQARGELDAALAAEADVHAQASKRLREVAASQANAAAVVALYETRLAAARAAAHEASAMRVVAHAPKGYREVACEAELLAVLAAPLHGSIHAAYADKEAQLNVLMLGLSSDDAHELGHRMDADDALPGDTLARELGKLSQARRSRLRAVLANASQRERMAQRRRWPHHTPAPTFVPAAASVVPPVDMAPAAVRAPSSSALAVAAEPMVPAASAAREAAAAVAESALARLHATPRERVAATVQQLPRGCATSQTWQDFEPLLAHLDVTAEYQARLHVFPGSALAHGVHAVARCAGNVSTLRQVLALMPAAQRTRLWQLRPEVFLLDANGEAALAPWLQG